MTHPSFNTLLKKIKWADAMTLFKMCSILCIRKILLLFFHFMQLIYEEWWWCCPSINNFLRKLIHKSSSSNAATPVVSTLRLFTKVVCTVKVQKKLMLWYNLAIGTWTLGNALMPLSSNSCKCKSQLGDLNCLGIYTKF